MLSYRHSFHAGNFADLLKHVTLIYLLEYLNKKAKPYVYLDTHSGAGLYDLTHRHATTTDEFKEGVGRLLAASPNNAWLGQLAALIRQDNAQQKINHYPGSPRLASRLVRPTDRLLLNELHPADHQQLERLFSQHQRCQIHQQDAFTLLKASLPPQERRGLILIDPSYENKQDYQQLLKALTAATKKFATGIYALWYPVINRQDTERWINQLAEVLPANSLRIEHCPFPDTSGLGMTGSGMLVVNPPYTLMEDFKPLLTELAQLLAQGSPGKVRLEAIN